MRRLLPAAILLAACRPAEPEAVAPEPMPSRAGPQPSSSPRPSGPSAGDPSPEAPLKEPGALAGITAAHSEIRDCVGLGPVSWDPELAAYAQEWADELQRRDCALEHRPYQGRFAQRYGENLFWQSGGSVRAADVVHDWASEEANYDLKRNRCRGVCGHYTQIVWKETARIGCATARCGAAEVWVCNYDPPGNVNNRRPY